MFKKLNVKNADVSDGRKPSKSHNTIASPNLTKIQEMISARSSNAASKSNSKSTVQGGVKLKKKRGLNLNAGRLPVMGSK